MNYLQLAILSLEAVIISILLLFLFRVRSRLGLSPLYITLGVFQPIQAILSSTIYVTITPGVIVSPGSVIMFTASLFVILLTYIFEDAAETRKAIYGIMFANLTMVLFLFISGVQSNLIDTVNILNLPRELFDYNARIMLVGTIVLLVDSILLIFVYETAWRVLGKNVFLRVYLSIAVILIFDSLAFTTGAFYGQPNYTIILTSGIIGKLIMAAFYASALTLYLRFAEPTNHKNHHFQDIFNLLSYRQKFEIERQRGQQVESQLHESEERYQILTRMSPVGIFLTDATGVTTYVNPKWCEISGVSFDNALGDGWLNAVHPEDKERISKGWQGSTQLKKDSSTDYRFLRPDGTIAWVIGQAVPETNARGDVIGYIGTITDITERKQAEEELRLHRDRLAELSKRLVTAHETERRAIARELHDQFGQMLTALQLTLEIAQQLPAEESAKKLAMAQEIINDLSSRVSRLSLELRPPMLDDLGLIPSLLWHINRYQEQTQIEVKFKHSGIEDKRLESDVETTAYRVIQEAMTNVARHAHATSIRLEVRVRDEWLEIMIEDNGQGFDPQTALAKNRGLGGMRERVKLLGGTFHIESGSGKGARQWIHLPFLERTS